MSWVSAPEPACQPSPGCEPVETAVVPRSRDLGGFEVRRVLPSRERRMVGPFVFFDQMGPAAFTGGRGLDVRPHPHIGLATVTYLFEGLIVHRDSLGTEQVIRPGDVNWMTAGRGIVHSERSDDITRQRGGRLSGIQSWVALPAHLEEGEPAFAHWPGADLPAAEGEGISLRVIAGEFAGRRSPVATASETLYADVRLEPGARLAVPASHEERALYPVSGTLTIAETRFAPMQLLVLKPGAEVVVEASEECRLILLGGESLDGPRHIWWNFVSSSKERIEQAKADWKAGRFDPVPGDDDFIPLPE